MAVVRRCKNEKSNYLNIKLLNGKVVASHDEHTRRMNLVGMLMKKIKSYQQDFKNDLLNFLTFCKIFSANIIY